METYMNDNEEIEIDLFELFMELKRKIWVILGVAVLCAGAAGAFSAFVLTPQYTSTAMVYILSKETTLTSLADLQIGSQLTKDYKIIVTSRPVLEDVIEGLELNTTYKDLKKKITIDNPADTRILSISVMDPDPQMAKAIADKVAATASDYVGDIMEMVPPKLIEDGEVPLLKTSPSNTKNALIGGLVGTLLVCGFVTARVVLNDTVRTEEDVTRYLGLTVLASVPARKGGDSGGQGSHGVLQVPQKDSDPFRKIQEEEKGGKSPMRQTVALNRSMKDDYHYNEAVKTLRTNIQFCGSGIRVIMMTSALPDEGKSDMAFALASSLAQIGKRVLLIDADIRKSVLVSRYQLEDEVCGLSQYLSGQKPLEEIRYATSVENLHMIFSGPYSPNPAELLEEELFGALIRQMRQEYDYLIIDTPPMGNLIDGAIVARQCDGAVMVVESGAVSYRLEQRVKNQLEKSGCRILGVVLNKIDPEYNSYGYYTRYGKYGKYSRYEKYAKYDKSEITEG